MISELIVYYPDDQYQILPFILAHIGQYQDTLILAPQSLAQKHDQFRNAIYSPLSNRKLLSIYSRAFSYDSRLCITLIFPSILKDEGGRSGLLFTVGCMISQDVFRKYHSVCRTYIKLMITQLNEIFDINLFKNGADNLLSKLQDDKNYGDFRKRLEITRNTLLAFIFPMPKIRNSLFRFPFSLKSRKKIIPKAILYPTNSMSEKYLDFFLSEIDSIFEESYLKKINVANVSFDETPGKDIITLIPVDAIPLDVIDARIKKLGDKKYICLY